MYGIERLYFQGSFLQFVNMYGIENCIHLFQLHLNSSVGDLALRSLTSGENPTPNSIPWTMSISQNWVEMHWIRANLYMGISDSHRKINFSQNLFNSDRSHVIRTYINNKCKAIMNTYLATASKTLQSVSLLVNLTGFLMMKLANSVYHMERAQMVLSFLCQNLYQSP